MNTDTVQRRIGLFLAASGSVLVVINAGLVAHVPADDTLHAVITHPRIVRLLAASGILLLTGVVCGHTTRVLQVAVLVGFGATNNLTISGPGVYGVGVLLLSVVVAYKYGFLEQAVRLKIAALCGITLVGSALTAGQFTPETFLQSLNSATFLIMFVVVIGIAFDEELRRLSSYNAELRNELKKSEQAVKIAQNTGGLVHNLRNDLGLIYASLQVARLTTDDTEHLNEIESKLERLSGRVDRIMYATKCSEIKELQHVDLDHLLASVVEGFQVERDFRRSVKVVHHFSGNMSIRAVPSELSQLFENLIKNSYDAIKAHEATLTHRGELGRVTVRTEQQDGEVFAVISDNGVGMEDTSIEQFRVGRTSKSNGSGYGMVYVIEAVKKYGGDIEIASTPGVGTTVRLRFGRAVTIPYTVAQTVQETR